MRRLYFCLFLCLSFALSAQAAPVQITRVEMMKDRGFDYLDIYTTGWSRGEGLLLEDKLYLDFPDAVFSPNFKLQSVRSKRIQNVTAEQKAPTTARLVVTLKQKIDYDIANMFGRNKSVVEIGDQQVSILDYQLKWEKKNMERKALPLKPVKLAATRGVALKGKVIILDPGHGGDDPGAFVPGGGQEKELTLQTAQRAAELFRAAGATVYLTRNEDRRSNLKDIADFANRTGADILISIHYNSLYDQGIGGTETYYYHPVSRRLAQNLHAALVRGLKRKDRGLHRVPFYVVKQSNIPAVLIEPVYLTNREETGLARSREFQEKLGDCLVKGVESYYH